MLPSLVTLRDALYSPQFRKYISTVANSGPLSGTKTDMAVNVYTPGCHLLCHDDVIGSRRVSYILYLTDPDIPWKPEWGGALRLYPTETFKEPDGSETKVPSADFSVVIPPAFNQLSFFAVQPGESFHDVEEVYARGADDADAEDGGRVRMAISGWFHIPQEGEEGYEEGAEERQAERSSLSQLQGGNGEKYDLPQPRWLPEEEELEVDDDERGRRDLDITEEDLSFLIQFMNPRYLTPDVVAELAEQFEEVPSLRLGQFLSAKFSAVLKDAITAADSDRKTAQEGWNTARPPHKHRFLYLQPSPSSEASTPKSNGKSKSKSKSKAKAPATPTTSLGDLHTLLNTYIPSSAFTKWLSLATGLPLSPSSNLLARRFRKGLDYTLATNHEDEDPQLEICLGLTPTTGWGEETSEDSDIEADADDADDADEEGETTSDAAENAVTAGSSSSRSAIITNGKTKAKPQPDSQTAALQQEEPLEIGGYEVYMAGEEPLHHPSKDAADTHSHDDGVPLPASTSQILSHTGAGSRVSSKKSVSTTNNTTHDPAVYRAAADDEADDGILLSNPAAWNILNVVLRDRGVLRFVKYVSYSAPGDRWDLVGEWRVGDDEDDVGSSSGEEEE